MRPWVDRVTFPSTALHYVADIVLNMLIVAGAFGLLMLLFLLFGSSHRPERPVPGEFPGKAIASGVV